MKIFLDFLKKLKFYGLEYFGLYYGVYHGFVVDNKDPENQGRLLVSVPAITGSKEVPLNRVAYPKFPFAGKDYGWYMIPDIGEAVWVEFENGHIEYPLWTGMWYAKGEKPSEVVDNKVRILKTPSGHKIIFDDREGQEKIQIIDKNNNKIVMSENGIKLEDKYGNIIDMNMQFLDIIPQMVCRLGGNVATVNVNNFPACLFTGAPHSTNTKVKA